MAEQLFYGDGRSLRLAWRHPIDVLWCAAPRIAPAADARLAARRAVEAPLDYPPLSALLAPEDRIALAVEPGVPEAAAIVRGVIDALNASGVQKSQITVLHASPAPLGSGVRELLHRPDEADSLAYLAATDDAYPIYLHRALYDADVVIPIGLRRPNNSYGYLGSPGTLYPLFADSAAQFRLLATSPTDWRRHGRSRRWEADRVAWQLGVQFRLEAVPGPHGQLAHIVGGQADSVARHTRRLMLDAWAQRLSQQVGIAIAGVEQLPATRLAGSTPVDAGGSTEELSGELAWNDVQRAFYTAARVVSDGGVIVVCASVKTPPSSVHRPTRAADSDTSDTSDTSEPSNDSRQSRDFDDADDADEAFADRDGEDSAASPDESPDWSSEAAARPRGRARGQSRGQSRGSNRGKSRQGRHGSSRSDSRGGSHGNAHGDAHGNSRRDSRGGPTRGGARGHTSRRLRAESPQAARLRRVELQPVRELLAELGESRRLYLMSDLPRDVVEELGCMPVETADEIALLARPFDTGVVIASAEYAHLALAREEDGPS